MGCNTKYYAKGYCKKHYRHIWKYGKILNRTRFDPNEIITKGGITEVVLYSQNQEIARTTIDAEDVKKIKKHKWRVSDGYAAANIKGKNVQIQHIIMGVKANWENQIDHKDRDRLNNRKSNFRFCTNAENTRNRKKPITNTSGFKGVSWVKRDKKWRAAITINKKWIHLGVFKDKAEAAKAYNKAALKHHGEFAHLNEI